MDHTRLFEVQESADAGQQQHENGDAEQVGRFQHLGGAGEGTATEWALPLGGVVRGQRMALAPALHPMAASAEETNSAADRNISPACPTRPTRNTPSRGPVRPPRLAPVAINANRRLA